MIFFAKRKTIHSFFVLKNSKEQDSCSHVCTSLIQHCISCISELLHYIVDDVEEILAKHVTF